MRYWSGEVSWNSSTIATGILLDDALAQRLAVRAFERRLQARQHVGEAELAVAPLQFLMRRAMRRPRGAAARAPPARSRPAPRAAPVCIEAGRDLRR
jgi:hypothetical protein